MAQRKLRRLNFDSIQVEMQVIYGDLLRNIVGGYQNDCFWRCVAYLDGNFGFDNPISESQA